jgi:hypothetical protein
VKQEATTISTSSNRRNQKDTTKPLFARQLRRNYLGIFWRLIH